MNVVVLGAGADELVAARLLAKGGHSVTVVQDQPLKDADGWVPPKIVSELGIHLTVEKHEEPLPPMSSRDAARWPEFTERMARVARLLERFYLQPPPGLVDFKFALGVRLLGRRGMEDLMRWLAMPVAELLDEWFESDVLKGSLGAVALRDVFAGPREAGTGFALLHRHVGCAPGVFRAPKTDFLERLRAGMQIRPGKIRRITIRGGHVAGVVLENGEEIAAAVVVSGVSVRRTLTELVEPGWLDPDLVRAARHIRSRRAMTDPAPAPSLDHLQRAYDEAKYRRQDSPGACAELSLDQALWMRPLPELARYDTPIPGLWLCGQDMHPGAGVAGAAGYNCAQRIMSTLRA